MSETAREERLERALRFIRDHDPSMSPSFDPYQVLQRIAALALGDYRNGEYEEFGDK